MKKSVVFVAVLFLSISSFAYGRNYDTRVEPKQEKQQKMKDCVMMKDGNMVIIKDGQSSEMTKAVTMSNGTKVLANGEVIMKNGETKKLENGDVVYMNGKIEKQTPA